MSMLHAVSLLQSDFEISNRITDTGVEILTKGTRSFV